MVTISPIRLNKENFKIVGVSACFAISQNGWSYRCENCQIVGVSACFAISPEWLVVSKENFQIVGVSACFAISPEWLVVSCDIVKLLVEVSVLQYLRNGWWYRCENCYILLATISPIRQNKQNLKIVGVSACFAISPE
ncbi:unnamed protein product [Schistosoma mattheei]|uniref:Uncharacterized protein n=1 Tax=Schistosoma mattheei TaxID=31246 RepID=A0A3P8FVL4_9TREM|nr:unnamed protein product [Schistosoma mattheei]